MNQINLFELFASVSLNTKEYESAIKKATNSGKTLQERLSDVSKSSETLKNKIKLLASQYSEAKSEVDRLTDAFNKSAKENGYASDETKRLAEELKDAEGKAGNLKSELDSLSNSAGKSTDSFQKMSDGFTMAKGVMSDLISNGIQKAIGTIQGLVSSVINLDKTTEEYRESQARLNSSFEAAGHSTDTAKQAYSELYSIMGETDTAVEAAQQISLLADSEAEVVKWSKLAAGVVGTFGDALQPETFFESANETLKLGEATGAYVQMLEGAGKDVDDFNSKLAACNTEQERQELLFETADSILGSAGDSYRKLSSNIIESNKSQEKMQDSMAKVGDAVAKVKNAFLEQFGPAIEKTAEKLAEWISKIDVDAISDRINRIVDNFKFGWEMISEIWSAAIEFFKTIGNGIMDAFVFVGDFISSIFQAANDAITWIFESLPSFFSGIWEGIKTVFSTVVEFFSNTFSNAWTMIQTVWSIVVGFFSGIWQGIQTVFSTVISFFSGIFSSAWSTISSIWSVVVGFFSGIWNGITSVFSSVASFFSTAFSNAITGIKSVWGTITTFFSGKWESIKGVFKDALSSFSSIGSNIVQGIKNGISNGWNALKNWVKEKAQSLLDAAKDALGISSPSKEFRDKVGIWIPAGIEEGLEKGTPSLLRTINDSIGPDNLIGDYNFSYEMTRTTRKGSSDQSLSYAINMLSDKLDNLKIYLDTGKMVGEMSSEIDKRLGKNLSINRKATIA